MSNTLLKHIGTVKWFNPTKGYGFITKDGHKSDIFIHKQQLKNSGVDGLAEGQKVSFVLNTGDKGDFATDIVKER